MKQILGCLVLWLLVSPGFALDGNLQFSQLVRDHWSVAQGLPQDHVTAVLQGHDGFLWVGTQQGLVRFDGVTFENWSEHVSPLQGREILSLVETDAGVLWVGTNRGLFLLSGPYRRQVQEIEGLTKVTVTALCWAGPGQMWAGGLRGELLKIVDGGVQQVDPGSVTGYDTVNSLALDGEGGVWIARNSGLYRGDSRSVRFLPVPGIEGPVLVADMKRDPRGRMWFATSAGLLRQVGETFVWVGRDQPGLDRGLSALEIAGSGRMWVAGYHVLFRFDWREEKPVFEKRVERDFAQVLYADRVGRMWLGYYLSGLVRFRTGRVVTFGVDQGLRNAVVRCTVEDGRGRLWFGTLGGLGCKDGETVHWYGSEEGYPESLVYSLAMDKQAERLWVGYDSGTVLVRDETGFTVQKALTEWHEGRRVRVMALQPGTRRLWVGGGKGLSLVDLDDFTIIKQRAFPEPVTALTFDEAGRPWVGTAHGLYRLDSDAGGTFEARLDEGFIADLFIDSEGIVWVATYGRGLIRIQGDRDFTITSDQGFFDNKPFRVLLDGLGYFWISSHRGIFRVAKRDLNQLAAGTRERIDGLLLDHRHGMLSAECSGGTHPAGMISRDGGLWFPTVAGLVRIDPTRAVRPDAPVVPVLNAVRLDGRAFFPEGPLAVPAETRRIEVLFTAARLAVSDPPVFTAQLSGTQTRDLPISERGSVFLSGLAPGHYQVRIRQAGVNRGATADLVLEVAGVSWLASMRLWLPVSIVVGCLLLVGFLHFQGRGRHQRVAQSLAEGQKELKTFARQQTELNQVMVQRFHYAGMAEIGMSVLQNVDQTLSQLDQYIRGLKRGLNQNTGLDGLRAEAARLQAAFDRGAEAWDEEEAMARVAAYERLRDALAARWEEQIEQVVGFRELVHQVCGLVEAQQQYAKLTSFEETVDLNIVVEDVCRIKQSILLENQVELIQDLMPVSLVKVPKARLMQVLVLLVRCGRNSLDTIKEGEMRKLKITTRPFGRREVKVEIGFSGVGYSMEELQALAEEPDLDSLAGMDFALCRRLLADFSASLQVETSATDRSAHLSLVLPVEENESAV
ncbi:two-component regulator propeller domain-containing protein [Acanthopleuribacter pedis]|uniref:Uncharacterized protein n=1 Tax=Acanthopleuribacter pedis TaxID=442870 RepID=A0A8J7U651_9BACT|nr:two-component regulator propeller domain-containing protein [Acanthopleuribacter pedis]MBO1319986.1 hypothetical protein [Acanthopleuribacter pedis]